MAEHPPNMMKVSFVRKLLAVSKNCDSAPADFRLCFFWGVEDAAVECIGYALRDNTRVQHLDINFPRQGAPIKEESMKGILHFVSNNPSLRALDFSARGNCKAVGALLKAAAANPNILKLRVELQDATPIPELCELVKCTRSLLELSLSGEDENCYEGLGQALSENDTIETLELGTSYERVGWRSGVLLALAKSKKSKIKNLMGGIWNSNLPTFLVSPHTAIQTLDISVEDFFTESDEVDADNSKIDLLLLALMGSQTITSLVFQSCTFDAPGINKFIEAFQAGWLAIRHLDFTFADVSFQREQPQRLLETGKLETLGFADSHDNDITVREIGELLRCTSLPRIRLSLPSLNGLGPALMTHMTLQSMELVLDQPTNEDASLLASMIINDNNQCQICDLSLRFCKFNETQWGQIIKALEGSKNLDSFSMKNHFYSMPKKLRGMIGQSLKKNESLRVLKIEAPRNETVDEIMLGLSMNKSLEEVTITDAGGSPIGTVGQHSNLMFVTQRNKMKKLIDAQSHNNTLVVAEWVDKLSDFSFSWEGLSLTFWLLQEQPAPFFSNFGSGDSHFGN